MRWPLGGIRTYLLYTHPALVRAGWRITFVGPEGEHFDALAQEVADWPGVAFVAAPRGRSPAFLTRATKRLLREQRFTLVNSQGLGAAAQVEAARRTSGKQGKRTPHVVTSHDVFPPGKHGGVKGWLRKRVLERLLRRADLIINVTDDARANLLEHLPAVGRAGTRMVTIPHGIRPLVDGDAGTLPLDPPLRTRLGVDAEPFLFGFLGRFMEQKGFLPLLAALQALQSRKTPRPFHLVAVGSGDYEREYRAEVEERGLAGAVTFLPFVPDVMPFLRELDAVVMPSLWEAAGLLAMEALVAGTPLLTSDCPGLREVVRDTPTRMARAGDVPAWTDALEALIAAPPLNETRAFSATARERFDASRTAERTVEVLGEVAARAERDA
jgi:glycosyltransferase involved in cell wall biosynthesis